jgi:hypothetical protein
MVRNGVRDTVDRLAAALARDDGCERRGRRPDGVKTSTLAG